MSGVHPSHDPLRSPPTSLAAAGTGAGHGGWATPATLPTLDGKGEKVRASAMALLGEPVLTVLVGRGLPPRKWPPVLAILVALIGAVLAPLGGFGTLVFWAVALGTAFVWRLHQDGRLPRRPERPAGAVAVTPTRLAVLGVDRGWFESTMRADEVIATAPLAALELTNRVGWGHVEVAGRPLYLDRSKRAKDVARANELIESVQRDGWHGPVPMPPPPTTAAAAPPHPPPPPPGPTQT